MNTECHIIEKAFAMINDAIRTYKDGVAKIDKRLSNLNYE